MMSTSDSPLPMPTHAERAYAHTKAPPASRAKAPAVMTVPPALTLIPTPVPQPIQEASAPRAGPEAPADSSQTVVIASIWKPVNVPVEEASQDVLSREMYKPILHDIVGYDAPVDNMSQARPDSNDNNYTLIKWDPDCVQPPYVGFYEDGYRHPPLMDQLTGYETVHPLHPVIFEEYWNRMIRAWVKRPMMKSVEPKHRMYRFEMREKRLKLRSRRTLSLDA
eukprot:1749480-Amphidinium_carterae.1